MVSFQGSPCLAHRMGRANSAAHAVGYFVAFAIYSLINLLLVI